jgi:integrase
MADCASASWPLCAAPASTLPPAPSTWPRRSTSWKGKLVVGPPKTKASRRKVSLPLGVMEELADHLRAPGRPTDQVFKAQGGGQLRISNFRRNIWRPAVADANLAGLRIHDLRHTAVALWIAAGASPKEVAARAGHTSVSFVLDRYGHLFPEADTALRARLDSLFRGALALPR